MIERPAVMFGGLAAAQISRDFRFHRAIHRLAEIVAQQDIFGGNGGVGFEFEHPVAVAALRGEQRLGRTRNRRIEGIARGGGFFGSVAQHHAAL